MMLDLVELLTQTGATCLMTEELTTSDIGMIDEHSVHGVIVLRPWRPRSSTVKTIEIVKMREAKHDDQTRLFLITD
jgi:KaiC/GvpD/RAD55 family RecA-like ATPase